MKKEKRAAEMMLRMYRDAKEIPGTEFEKAQKAQGYRDCLEAMKRAGLIKDYNLRDLIVIE